MSNLNIRIPSKVLTNSDLKPIDKLIIIEIMMSPAYNKCSFTNNWFSKTNDVSNHTIVRAIKRLKQNDLIKTCRATIHDNYGHSCSARIISLTNRGKNECGYSPLFFIQNQ